MTSDTTPVELIHAHHTTIKRLGNWTCADRFELRARSGAVVLDLRSPDLPDDLDILLDLQRSVVKLLVTDDTTVDHWDLRWSAKGRLKDVQDPAGGRRRLRLSGTATDSEVRVQRGGVAILTAVLSREFLRDARHAHDTGSLPTVDDPTRGRR